MKPLLELGRDDCRWPVNGDDKPFIFCAAPRDQRPLPSGKSCPYCAEHRLRAYSEADVERDRNTEETAP